MEEPSLCTSIIALYSVSSSVMTSLILKHSNAGSSEELSKQLSFCCL